MKKIIILSGLLIFCLQFFAYANNPFSFAVTTCVQSDILDNISSAMKTGSAKELLKNCLEPVEIGLLEKKQNYNAAQAETHIKNFFAKYPPVSFEYVHQGTSQDGLFYVIGRYVHKSGEFQVYILMKKQNGQSKIDTIDFSQE